MSFLKPELCPWKDQSQEDLVAGKEIEIYGQ